MDKFVNHTVQPEANEPEAALNQQLDSFDAALNISGEQPEPEVQAK
jgi:hypothetical protein